MVGILSSEMLEIARFKVVLLEESASWVSLIMIFKDTILLGSPAVLLGVVGLEVEALFVAVTGAQ